MSNPVERKARRRWERRFAAAYVVVVWLAIAVSRVIGS